MSSLQLLVGLVLLFIYEGYKSHYFDSKSIMPSAVPGAPPPEDFTLNDPSNDDGNNNNGTLAPQKGTTIINNYALDQSDDGGRFLNTPMDIIFYLSIINNVFSVMGLAGTYASEPERGSHAGGRKEGGGSG